MDYIAQFGFHWFWFGTATLLLAIEAVHGKFMFMAASLAAVALGILSHFYPGIAFPIQILFFGVIAAVFIWVARSSLETRMERIRRQQEIVQQRSYVGQVLTLVSPIENGRAHQNLDGTVWTLQGPDAPAGAQVRVVDMGAGWLRVEALD
ncbi:hypothetical protein Tel_14945 [Candidatus Tenderia electrophaga]|jgi:hypothetical protein|uniref:Uncharacterized protein n=1 Tax=Candidatus Tenderia electrophaga TaxID=1748243 RepID=A0A0S2TGU1_9GAMM|nr:hypothetical protein Tel_14945 [Candidatus Tenderia electrophaga]